MGSEVESLPQKDEVETPMWVILPQQVGEDCNSLVSLDGLLMAKRAPFSKPVVH